MVQIVALATIDAVPFDRPPTRFRAALGQKLQRFVGKAEHQNRFFECLKVNGLIEQVERLQRLVVPIAEVAFAASVDRTPRYFLAFRARIGSQLRPAQARSFGGNFSATSFFRRAKRSDQTTQT